MLFVLLELLLLLFATLLLLLLLELLLSDFPLDFEVSSFLLLTDGEAFLAEFELFVTEDSGVLFGREPDEADRVSGGKDGGDGGEGDGCGFSVVPEFVVEFCFVELFLSLMRLLLVSTGWFSDAVRLLPLRLLSTTDL